MANEVAAILSERLPSSMTLEEHAGSLVQTQQFDDILRVFQERTPNDEIRGLVNDCRGMIASRLEFTAGAIGHDRTARAMAPDRDIREMSPAEHRSGSVYMTGGLGDLPDVVEELQRKPDLKSEADLSNDSGRDFIYNRVDTERLNAHDAEQRIKAFGERYPHTLDLFLFHVKKACASSTELKRLETGECAKIASAYFEAMPESQRQEWADLHQQLLRGDSQPLSIPAGTEMLGRHGCLDHLLTASGRFAATSSSSQGIRFGLSWSSAQSRVVDQDPTGTVFNATGQEKLVSPTWVWYPSYISTSDNISRVGFVVNTPWDKPCNRNPEQFRAACMNTYADKVNLGMTEQASNNLWYTVFHRREDEQAVLKTKRSVTLGGVSLFPERLPRTPLKRFYCNLHNISVSEEEVARSFKNALGSFHRELGISATTEEPRLYMYSNNRYYICFPNHFGGKWLLRFYLPLLYSGGTHIACFRPSRVDTAGTCPYCPRRHAAPCENASPVDLALSGGTVSKVDGLEGGPRNDYRDDTASGECLMNDPTERLKVQFPNRRSVFLYHVLEACRIANVRLTREECDQRGLEFWNSFDHDQKKKWLSLAKLLWKGDATALKTSAAVELLSEHGIPGALIPTTGDDSNGDDSDSDGSDGDGSDSDDSDGDESGSGNSSGGGSQYEPESVGRSEVADGPTQSHANNQQSGSQNKGDNHTLDRRVDALQPTRAEHSEAPALKFSAHDYVLTPMDDSNGRGKINGSIVNFQHAANQDSRLGFVIANPECPVRGISHREASVLFTTQLGSAVRKVSGPVHHQTFSVQLQSPESVRMALNNRTSVILGDYRVYAEPLPAKDITLFLCDFGGVQVPDSDLVLGVQDIFSSRISKVVDFELLKYPGSQYLIHFSEPRRYLRLYVKLRWSSDEICIARFRAVDATTPRSCPLCRRKHPWPCAKAEKVSISAK